MSVTRLKCSSLTPEASAQLPSALQPNVAIAGPSAMHAQQGRDSHQVREPHTRRWRLAVLSVAAQCCYRQVPRTPNMSVTHIQRTSLTQEAGAWLPSALQPNAAVAECHARFE
jgi:hypothetical protein